mmetsp:Transcript_8922/g.26212  ORF Transcript_8922/g.26212 Transcript_8922/m.26212 type:complete len:313 (+) Transcript_8922:79-1017(+)|eukprot:CAMPEP_0168445036 /NCGR_PEP_ID=MMETSP0228-20121227/45359_1 /TAXON_ID=133427 /ORGANISM="Protoceratium reticulatum, Strain CCCM 535 (=CCMP 1889)" /LENGTH=312 /DNA_ID=CAMNT_0008459501 /DNA_START=79 /DNA_END=1017 /DNA_ORIENTATION=+
MEFQAYPSIQKTRKDIYMLLRVQGVLHSSDSVLLPVVLLIGGTGLVIHAHMTSHITGRHSTKAFLMKLLISMLPLAILERKMVSCADPVRLFSRFSAKVLMMHACFLGLRLVLLGFPHAASEQMKTNCAFFVLAGVLLPAVFKLRLSFAFLWEHRDVFSLALLAITLAVTEVMLLGNFSRLRMQHWWSRTQLIEDMLMTGSDYIELVAFVPAVWMACRHGLDSVGTSEADIRNSQKRALTLFAFLLAFYSFEDLSNAYQIWDLHFMAAVGHVGHFVFLLDFVAFLLAHLYDPERFTKFREMLRSWVVDANAV